MNVAQENLAPTLVSPQTDLAGLGLGRTVLGSRVMMTPERGHYPTVCVLW